MKKPKISLDKDKLQAFFLNHVEKMILVVVIGLMLLLVWRGLSLPHLEGGMDPVKLVSATEEARQYVEDPERWVNQVREDRVGPIEVTNKVLEVLKKTDPLAYMLPHMLNRPDFPKLNPRQDPELFPPIQLVVRPVIGPLASYLKPTELSYSDPLFPLTEDEDDPLKRRALEKKRQLEAKRKAEAMATEGDGAMPGGPAGRGKTRRGRGAAAGEEYAGEGMAPRGRRGSAGSAMDGGDGGYGMGAMGGYGQLGENGLTTGGLYPEAEIEGYIPQNPDQTIARNVASITLMALVPLQKQIEEFDKKFTEALDYDPRRDTPIYLDYQIEKADVTDLDPDAEIDPKLWTRLPAPATVLKELLGDPQNPNAVGLYAGVPLDVVDPTYLDYEVLTHPAPPYLQRDLWDLLTHPEVPLATFNLYGDGMMPGAEGTTPATSGGEDAPTLPVGRLPGMMSGGGDEGGYGPGMGGGFGRMPGGYGGMPGGGMPGGYGGMGGSAMGGYMPRPGGYGMAGEDSEGGGYGYGSAAMTYTPPKYKLIRFTDTRVKPGRKYRYRVRLFLHDPNHPMLGIVPPSMASLDGKVQTRVKELDAADAKGPKDPTTGLPRRTAWVLTPWSEPSPIAELPPPSRVLVVKVKPKNPSRIKGVEVTLSEPEAEALAVVFDPSKVADIPAENTRVVRGAVLNFSQDKLKVIHPVTKEVVDLPTKYEVTTNALVADLMGGETIKPINASASSQSLSAIGELLVMDAYGNLHVQNEFDDIEKVRRISVPKEDPRAAAAAASADGAMPMPGEGVPRRGRRANTDF